MNKQIDKMHICDSNHKEAKGKQYLGYIVKRMPIAVYL